MQVTEAVTLSDIVSQDAPIPNVFTEDIEQGINLVIIARLVPNKGVSEFLNALLNQRVSGQLTVKMVCICLCKRKILERLRR